MVVNIRYRYSYNDSVVKLVLIKISVFHGSRASNFKGLKNRNLKANAKDCQSNHLRKRPILPSHNSMVTNHIRLIMD